MASWAAAPAPGEARAPVAIATSAGVARRPSNGAATPGNQLELQTNAIATGKLAAIGNLVSPMTQGSGEPRLAGSVSAPRRRRAIADRGVGAAPRTPPRFREMHRPADGGYTGNQLAPQATAIAYEAARRRRR